MENIVEKNLTLHPNDDIMAAVAGIKYTYNPAGSRRFVHIDLDVHGENQSLEDFLDGLDVMARQCEPTISLEEFNRYIDERVKMNV